MATQQQQNGGRTDPEKLRTTFVIERENGAFHATEPDGDHDLVGRGETRTEAVRHYCDLVDEIKRGGDA